MHEYIQRHGHDGMVTIEKLHQPLKADIIAFLMEVLYGIELAKYKGPIVVREYKDHLNVLFETEKGDDVLTIFEDHINNLFDDLLFECWVEFKQDER